MRVEDKEVSSQDVGDGKVANEGIVNSGDCGLVGDAVCRLETCGRREQGGRERERERERLRYIIT